MLPDADDSIRSTKTKNMHEKFEWVSVQSPNQTGNHEENEDGEETRNKEKVAAAVRVREV